MRIRGRAALAGLVAVTLMGGVGCVTKRQFRDNVESVDGRMSSVESGVEANERRIQDLRSETDSKVGAIDEKAGRALQVGQEASSKAEMAQVAADKAAKGRLLWTVTLTDDSARFGFNQASLGPDSMAALDELAAKVKSYGKAVYLEIEGHTDSTGDESYNMMLGEKRAEAARNYLNMKGGIPLHAMNVISYGETQPIADNATRDGRAQNRRVVVKVLE